MTTWLSEVFDVPKPVIGMCHLPALPGDPGYDAAGGMDKVLAHARQEVAALQDGGIDGILISNEFSLPYLTTTEPITAVAMARVIGEIRSELRVPFGVNVLWDGVASIDLAVSTGASFVREVFTGVYASDFGLWNTDVGKAARHRARMGATGVRLLYNIVPEAAAYLAERSLAQLTRSTVFNGTPDGLCVSGLTAGAATDTSTLAVVKENAGAVPVFVNTGVRPDTVAESLEYADAAIVGTSLKRDGVFENEVDRARVAELMAVVRGLRA
ncbi:BtpA/SgcQ family protein [Isoptericola sp. b441]|uniref:BtpA/SgcQ family protein n=1 Tax=Actinotalea lenta TaxID=3064654 RepID=A0ABT9DBU4_9CELL|nr:MULTISPECIES: BtpA/SgcQ family protein [unclassified Isoptericola]MDO8108352.1 BtpA/SgcQ family protein [Isoptericola sp. b441]MDO8119751.1 BtpA/SgcQ family protein [Isoptericola sp. b490]